MIIIIKRSLSTSHNEDNNENGVSVHYQITEEISIELDQNPIDFTAYENVWIITDVLLFLKLYLAVFLVKLSSQLTLLQILTALN